MVRTINLQLFAQEKTEDPTPRRRRKAREEGRTYRSAELSSSLILLAGLLVLRNFGYYMLSLTESFVRRLLTQYSNTAWTQAVIERMLQDVIFFVGRLSAPLFVVVGIVAIIVNLAQTRFVFSTQPLSPQLSRLNPIAGFKRIFSKRALIEFAKSLLKLILVAWVAWNGVQGVQKGFLKLAFTAVTPGLGLIGSTAYNIIFRSAMVLLALAVGDYFYQRWEYESSLRMSKREVEEERKEMEGDPQIKSQRRRRQQELSQQRMLEKAVEADVVITNPVHVAVALQYEMEKMVAPIVVAKGKGVLADRIKEIAEREEIPITEEPPLARALHDGCEVGEPIPENLYQAVAEVLAMVWHLREET